MTDTAQTATQAKMPEQQATLLLVDGETNILNDRGAVSRTGARFPARAAAHADAYGSARAGQFRPAMMAQARAIGTRDRMRLPNGFMPGNGLIAHIHNFEKTGGSPLPAFSKPERR